MASYNRVILIGNVTRDPELRYIPSGTAVTDVGLAVNDRRKGANGEWIEETDWFPGDLQSALGNLINAGKVRNLDSLRKRPKKPLHWDKEESLNLTEKVK